MSTDVNIVYCSWAVDSAAYVSVIIWSYVISIMLKENYVEVNFFSSSYYDFYTYDLSILILGDI